MKLLFLLLGLVALNEAKPAVKHLINEADIGIVREDEIDDSDKDTADGSGDEASGGAGDSMETKAITSHSLEDGTAKNVEKKGTVTVPRNIVIRDKRSKNGEAKKREDVEKRDGDNECCHHEKCHGHHDNHCCHDEHEHEHCHGNDEGCNDDHHHHKHDHGYEFYEDWGDDDQNQGEDCHHDEDEHGHHHCDEHEGEHCHEHEHCCHHEHDKGDDDDDK